jgi:hypothetical protein
MLLYALQMSFARFYLTRFRSNETARGSRLTSIQVKFELYRGHRALRRKRAGRVAGGHDDPPKVSYDSRKVTRDLY